MNDDDERDGHAAQRAMTKVLLIVTPMMFGVSAIWSPWLEGKIIGSIAIPVLALFAARYFFRAQH